MAKTKRTPIRKKISLVDERLPRSRRRKGLHRTVRNATASLPLLSQSKPQSKSCKRIKLQEVHAIPREDSKHHHHNQQEYAHNCPACNICLNIYVDGDDIDDGIPNYDLDVGEMHPAMMMDNSTAVSPSWPSTLTMAPTTDSSAQTQRGEKTKKHSSMRSHGTEDDESAICEELSRANHYIPDYTNPVDGVVQLTNRHIFG